MDEGYNGIWNDRMAIVTSLIIMLAHLTHLNDSIKIVPIHDNFYLFKNVCHYQGANILFINCYTTDLFYNILVMKCIQSPYI